MAKVFVYIIESQSLFLGTGLWEEKLISTGLHVAVRVLEQFDPEKEDEVFFITSRLFYQVTFKSGPSLNDNIKHNLTCKIKANKLSTHFSVCTVLYSIH